MASVKDWEKEAIARATEEANKYKTDNNYLIDNIVNAKNNALANNTLEQQNAIQKLEGQRSGIYSNAEDSAKQLNVNRLMSLKSTQEALNRAGLGTQGIVGTQSAGINNQYGENLTNVLKNRSNQLNELDTNINDTNTQYGIKANDIETQYNTNLANMQKSINDQALEQYNNIYKQYLAMKQQEFENDLATKQYNLSRSKSYSSSGGSTSIFNDNGQADNGYKELGDGTYEKDGKYYALINGQYVELEEKAQDKKETAKKTSKTSTAKKVLSTAANALKTISGVATGSPLLTISGIKNLIK